MTAAAAKNGINANEFGREVFVLRVKGDDIFALGGENRGAMPSLTRKVSRSTPVGTLYAVYELLERILNVRWLWSGEIGTYIPFTRTVVVERGLDLKVKPALRGGFWTGHLGRALKRYKPSDRQLSFSKKTG